MPIGFREKVAGGLVLTACAVAVVWHTATRPPADPCDADPGAYACAMFAQPEWLKRRVYAGRSEPRPVPAPAFAAATETVAASAHVAELGADGI